MLTEVISRLQALGYTVREEDSRAVSFAVEKAEAVIKNECNVEEIPEGLYPAAVDMACGEFLYMKRAVSSGEGGGPDGLEMREAVQRIKEGDTDITFAAAGEAISFDGLVDALRNAGKAQFARYRRLRW